MVQDVDFMLVNNDGRLYYTESVDMILESYTIVQIKWTNNQESMQMPLAAYGISTTNWNWVLSEDTAT